ncbi:ATP-binding protein [Shimia sp. R9_3]|uniref:hybrid sensor histidine kinase/response regulator n=1 Tax=Shimia sp. R9_3 TaxID=2821113 RepID=UPI001ADC63D7|nr:ATP-binding protein [Shimia sp. R9_3]MBO9400957.1 response regulator [Shimia sp. R9_3]
MAQLRTTKRFLRLRSGTALAILLVASLIALVVALSGRDAVETRTNNTTRIDAILLSLSEMSVVFHQIQDGESQSQNLVLRGQLRRAAHNAQQAFDALSGPNVVESFSPDAQAILTRPNMNPLMELEEVLYLADVVVAASASDTSINLAAKLASDLSFRLMPFFNRVRQSEVEAAEAAANDQVLYGLAALLVTLLGVGIAIQFAHLPMERYVLGAQMEIERNQRAAEAASEAKSMFLATMSHEIRTPLNGVLGLADVLSDTQLNKEQRRMLGMIASSGRDLLQIINDVLDLSKLEAGKSTLEFVDFDLETLCRETTDLFSGQAIGRDVELSVSVSPSDAGWYLHAAPSAVRQVLSNLVGNAVKFTENGKVTVHLEDMSGPEGAPRFVRIAVKDEGIGISPEAVDRIFNQFEQADTSTTTRFGGTGLGLSIVKRLAETMNGRINVHSVLHEGSEFALIIPVAKALHRKERPQVIKDALFDKFVLVADDNRVNQIVAQKLLQKLGCEVRLAGNGEEAVKLVRDWMPDLVLMDVRMPVMDGLEATRQIRADLSIPNAQTLPIVGLSANALDEHADASAMAGMSGYLEKPITREALVAELLRHWPDTPQTQDREDLSA